VILLNIFLQILNAGEGAPYATTVYSISPVVVTL